MILLALTIAIFDEHTWLACLETDAFPLILATIGAAHWLHSKCCCRVSVVSPRCGCRRKEWLLPQRGVVHGERGKEVPIRFGGTCQELIGDSQYWNNTKIFLHSRLAVAWTANNNFPEMISHQPWQRTCSEPCWELKFTQSGSLGQNPIFYLLKFGKYGTFVRMPFILGLGTLSSFPPFLPLYFLGDMAALRARKNGYDG
jgi:hypothetical protein